MKRCISFREEEEFMTCVQIADCEEGFVVVVLLWLLLLFVCVGGFNDQEGSKITLGSKIQKVN